MTQRKVIPLFPPNMTQVEREMRFNTWDRDHRQIALHEQPIDYARDVERDRGSNVLFWLVGAIGLVALICVVNWLLPTTS